MADIRLAKPAAGATQSVPCEPEARFVFDFPTTDATLARDGDNLNIRFEDGSNLQLEGFYQQYNEENLPSFNIDGTEVPAADFFAAMNEPDLMPAAGPGTGTVANGARFHEWGDSALTGGITHLNGLDWGFSRSFEWDDVPNAVGRNGDDWGWWSNRGGAADNPVTLVPEDPTPVPPGTPDIPGLPDGGAPGNKGIVPPGDVRVVDEAGLRNGGTVSVNGAMLVTAPDGLATIEIAGQAIWQNGHIIGNPSFATHEGYFHNFAYDAATGRLTYTYTLTQATQEHGAQGPDHIAHSLPVTVRDTDGDSASSHITIVIKDDTPEAIDDAVEAVEGGSHIVSNNVLDNDTRGADDLGTFAGGRTVRWNVPEGTEEQTAGDGRHFYELKLSAGDKVYGTVTLYDDGEYVLDPTTQGEVWEGGVTEFPVSYSYSIVDRDNDISHATLNLKVVKSVPSVTPNEPDPKLPEDPKPGDDEHFVHARNATITTDESALKGGSGLHTEHGFKGNGTVTLEVNGEGNGACTLYLSDGTSEKPIEHPLPASEDGNKVTFTEPSTFTVNGVEVTFTAATYEAGHWTLTYSYELKGAQTHDQGEHNQVLGGPEAPGITVTVKDASGDEATGTVTVEVHDDIPVVSNVTGAVSTVQVVMGADKADASEEPEYLSVQVYLKDGGEALKWTDAKGDTAEIYNQDGSFKAGIYTTETDEGTLQLTVSEDGKLEFELQPTDEKENHKVELTVKAIDADGDEAKADVQVSTPKVTPNEPDPKLPEDPKPGDDEHFVHARNATITTDESALKGGSGLHTDHGFKGDGTVTLEVNGEGNGACTLYLSDGTSEKPIEHALPASEDGNKVTFTEPSTFIVNGVEVTFTAATYEAGHWTLNYSYELTGAQTHDQAGGHDKVLGADKDPGITVTVKDASGDEATGTVTVEVHDDVPVIDVVGDLFRESDHSQQIKGVVDLDFGADSEGGSTSLVLELNIGASSQNATGVAQDDGSYHFQFENTGNVVLTPTADGHFDFTYTSHRALNITDADLKYDFKFTITDADNDKDYAQVECTIKPTTFSPEPDPGPNDPGVNNIIIGGTAGEVQPDTSSNLAFLFDLSGSCSVQYVGNAATRGEYEPDTTMGQQQNRDYIAFTREEGGVTKHYFQGAGDDHHDGHIYCYEELYQSMQQAQTYIKAAYADISDGSTVKVLLGGFDIKVEAAVEFTISSVRNADTGKYDKDIEVRFFASESPTLQGGALGKPNLSSDGFTDKESLYSAELKPADGADVTEWIEGIFHSFEKTVLYNISTAFSAEKCGFTYTASNIDNALGFATGWFEQQGGDNNHTFLLTDGGATVHTTPVTGNEHFFNNWWGSKGNTFYYDLTDIKDYWVGNAKDGAWKGEGTYDWQDVEWKPGQFAVLKVSGHYESGEPTDYYVVVNQLGLVCGLTSDSGTASQLKYYYPDPEQLFYSAPNYVDNQGHYVQQSVPVVMDWDAESGCYVPCLIVGSYNGQGRPDGDPYNKIDEPDEGSQKAALGTAEHLRETSGITVIKFGTAFGADTDEYAGDDGLVYDVLDWNYVQNVIYAVLPKPVADTIFGAGGDDLIFGDSLVSPSEQLNPDGRYDPDVSRQANEAALLALFTSLGGVSVEDLTEADKAALLWQKSDEVADTLDRKGGLDGGADILTGGDGNDLLFGMGGNDVLIGDGTQNSFQELAQVVADVSGLEKAATAEGLVTAMTAMKDQDAEKLTALGEEIDRLSSGEAAGNDKLYGGESADVLLGMDGDDKLIGGAGDDFLFGGAGNDYLDGGEGVDTIFGGSGNDLIVYQSSDYLIDGGADIDVLLAGAEVTDTLADMTASKQVNDVEVLIKGADALDITSMDDLAAKLGVHIEGGKMTLDKGWNLKEAPGEAGKNAIFEKGDVTLETNIQDITDNSSNPEAEQAAYTLIHTQG